MALKEPADRAPATARHVYITTITHSGTKLQLAILKERLLLNIGDELMIGEEVFVVQNSATMAQGPSVPDKDAYANEVIDKKTKATHKDKRMITTTISYRVATPKLSRKLNRIDLANKQVFKITNDKTNGFKATKLSRNF